MQARSQVGTMGGVALPPAAALLPPPAIGQLHPPAIHNTYHTASQYSSLSPYEKFLHVYVPDAMKGAERVGASLVRINGQQVPSVFSAINRQNRMRRTIKVNGSDCN
jgi:hypothetical protein